MQQDDVKERLIGMVIYINSIMKKTVGVSEGKRRS